MDDNEYFLILSSKFIINNWASIEDYFQLRESNSPFVTPNDLINHAKKECLYLFGARLIIMDKLPKF